MCSNPEIRVQEVSEYDEQLNFQGNDRGHALVIKVFRWRVFEKVHAAFKMYWGKSKIVVERLMVIMLVSTCLLMLLLSLLLLLLPFPHHSVTTTNSAKEVLHLFKYPELVLPILQLVEATRYKNIFGVSNKNYFLKQLGKQLSSALDMGSSPTTLAMRSKTSGIYQIKGSYTHIDQMRCV